MVNVEKEKVVKLPVAGTEVRLKRLSWGERLEIEDMVFDQRSGRTDLRMLHALMVERCSEGALKKEDYLAMDINDGFVLRSEVQALNGIDESFLRLYGQAPAAGTST